MYFCLFDISELIVVLYTIPFPLNMIVIFLFILWQEVSVTNKHVLVAFYLQVVYSSERHFGYNLWLINRSYCCIYCTASLSILQVHRYTDRNRWDTLLKLFIYLLATMVFGFAYSCFFLWLHSWLFVVNVFSWCTNCVILIFSSFCKCLKS